MSHKAITPDQRGATPLAAIAAIVAVAVTIALLLSAAAPVSAADVGSTSMSADADKYTVAPGGEVIIKIADMPDSTGISKVNFEDADGFIADEFFTVTSTEKDLNASIKIVADKEAPLGEYTVEIIPAGNATEAVTVILTVQHSVIQVLSGNAMYLGTGIGLIVVAGLMGQAIRNKKAKRITKPLGTLMIIAGVVSLAWVAYQVVVVLI